MRVNTIMRFIASNLGWMGGSIIAALAIWIAANMANNPVAEKDVRNVPVDIKLPDGYVITDQPLTETVTAVVRATQDQRNLMLPSDILVTADLSDKTEPGDYRIELEAEVISSRRGSIVALRPSTWTISIDRKIEERFAIQVVVTQDPPLGYTYPQDLTCNAAEVVVSGNEARVSEVARVEARLNLSDDLNPVTRTVNLTAVKADGFRASAGITLEPAQVECFVDIQIHEGITPVEVLPYRGRTQPPPGYVFKGYDNITPERVGVTGDANAIEAMKSVVSTIPIDLSEQTGTFTTEVPLALPEGVTLVPENQLVRVTVLIDPVQDNREFQDIPVEITGLDTTQFTASGLAATVTVNVTGPQVGLARLEADDLRVLVDLTDLPPGNHQVDLTATIIGQNSTDYSITSVVPEQLSVTIEALNPTPTPDSTSEPTATTRSTQAR